MVYLVVNSVRFGVNLIVLVVVLVVGLIVGLCVVSLFMLGEVKRLKAAPATPPPPVVDGVIVIYTLYFSVDSQVVEMWDSTLLFELYNGSLTTLNIKSRILNVRIICCGI